MAVTIAGTAASLNRHAVLYNKDIQQVLRQGLEFEKVLTPRACDNTYSAPNASMSDLIQAYQWEFTPKGDVTFDAVENKLQKIKIDIIWTADDLEAFWDSWMVEWHEIGKDEKQWTFHKYLYQEVMLPKILEELNHNSYNGTYLAPTPGTAGLSINSVDGYGKKIADAITASDLTPYPTGALVAGTMVNQVESWCDSFPVLYRDKPGDIYMSPTHAKAYWRNYRANFGTGNSNMGNENNALKIDATNKRIVPIAAMEGKDRLIFNPSATKNMIWGTRRRFPTYPVIRWKDTDIRVIKGTAEFYRFYGVNYWENLLVNDQV